MGIYPEGKRLNKVGSNLRLDRGEKEVPTCQSRENPGSIGVRLPKIKPISSPHHIREKILL
jgi:hypothetical protein